MLSECSLNLLRVLSESSQSGAESSQSPLSGVLQPGRWSATAWSVERYSLVERDGPAGDALQPG